MDTVVVNSLLALIVAFGIAALLGPLLIPVLHRLKFGQNVRSNGPQSHLKKQDTPTMGGVMILAALVLATLIFARKNYMPAILGLLMAVLFGLIGFFDDFIKIYQKRSTGLSAWQKIVAQFVLAIGFALILYFHPSVGSTIWLDRLDLGVFYIPYAVFVIIATVNSVNLIDGADGLAASVTGVYMLSGAAMLVLFVLSFRNVSLDAEQSLLASEMLNRMSGLSVFAAAIAGSCFGFLLHNAYPAKVFMGDLGSFLLGGAVAAFALFSRTSLLLPLMGILYVATTVSDILQVGSYKLRQKRIFRMAPLHHHLELSGMPESKIVSIYTVITAVACATGIVIFWFCK